MLLAMINIVLYCGPAMPTSVQVQFKVLVMTHKKAFVVLYLGNFRITYLNSAKMMLPGKEVHSILTSIR